MHVIRAPGFLVCFVFNRTFSRLLIFPDLWQSGSCFLFPRCTFCCCLFSINFQMSLLIHFISSTFYPFLNFCIILSHDTFLLLFHSIQMDSRNLLQLHKILLAFPCPNWGCPSSECERNDWSAGGTLLNGLPADSQMLLRSEVWADYCIKVYREEECSLGPWSPNRSLF